MACRRRVPLPDRLAHGFLYLFGRWHFRFWSLERNWPVIGVGPPSTLTAAAADGSCPFRRLALTTSPAADAALQLPFPRGSNALNR